VPNEKIEATMFLRVCEEFFSWNRSYCDSRIIFCIFRPTRDLTGERLHFKGGGSLTCIQRSHWYTDSYIDSCSFEVALKQHHLSTSRGRPREGQFCDRDEPETRYVLPCECWLRFKQAVSAADGLFNSPNSSFLKDGISIMNQFKSY
jgi:hypothetical protein